MLKVRRDHFRGGSKLKRREVEAGPIKAWTEGDSVHLNDLQLDEAQAVQLRNLLSYWINDRRHRREREQRALAKRGPSV